MCVLVQIPQSPTQVPGEDLRKERIHGGGTDEVTSQGMCDDAWVEGGCGCALEGECNGL